MEKFFPIYLREKDLDSLRVALENPLYASLKKQVPGLMPAIVDPLPTCGADVVISNPPILVSHTFAILYHGSPLRFYATFMFKDEHLFVSLGLPKSEGRTSLVMIIEECFFNILCALLQGARSSLGATPELALITDACKTWFPAGVTVKTLDDAIETFNLQDRITLFVAPNATCRHWNWLQYSVNTGSFNFQHYERNDIRKKYGNIIFDAASKFETAENNKNQGATL